MPPSEHRRALSQKIMLEEDVFFAHLLVVIAIANI
jgi:hypothetical protein